MGVRFQCPNGHKLHVKAELAGKRGICPECGAKFVVPSFSGGRAPVDTGESATMNKPPPTPRGTTPPPPASASVSPAESVFIKTQPLPPPAPPVAAAASAASVRANHEPVAWYVRPASGGQFGPATTEVLQEWIESGRVAADSWVWRTGWTDWKAGGEALTALAKHAQPNPVAAMAALDPASGAVGVSSASNVELTSAEARRREIKRRKQRMRTVSTVLALVTLAMLTALVFVLAR